MSKTPKASNPPTAQPVAVQPNNIEFSPHAQQYGQPTVVYTASGQRQVTYPYANAYTAPFISTVGTQQPTVVIATGSSPAYDPEAVGATSLAPREVYLVNGYKLARIIRIFAMIDLVFIVIYGFIYPLFFLAIPFPVCGYLSGKSFRKDYAIVYAVFVAVQVLVRVVVLVFSSNAIGVFLSILSMLLEIWIFRFVLRYVRFLRSLTDEDVLFLVGSLVIKAMERDAWC